MVNRVCLGQRATGEFGIWISKPGVDVMSAADEQLLLASDMEAVQIIARGSFTMAAGSSTTTVTTANYGFRPVVLFAVPTTTDPVAVLYAPSKVQWTSNTSLVFTRTNNQQAVTVRYILLNQAV